MDKRKEIPVTCSYDENGYAAEICFSETIVVKNDDTIQIVREPYATKVFIISEQEPK